MLTWAPVVDEQREVPVHAGRPAPRRGGRFLCPAAGNLRLTEAQVDQAYEDFVAGGGDLYVPTPEEKAAFKEAAAPVYDWFKGNVGRGGEIFGALEEAVAAAEADINANRSADLN